MSIKRSVSRLMFSGFIVIVGAGSALVQAQTPTPPPVDPQNGPRKVRPEPIQAYKRWVSEDVAPIITPEEVKAFWLLKTDEERENFIAIFWHNRDPDPETEENEYRDQYYERSAYANENFASGIPGWKTDRGRIYIRWGKPDSVESHPTGGGYERPVSEGGGSTTTYPFETWFYRHLDGVGDGIEIEFVDRTSTGEYRIARDPKEKDALANVTGGSAGQGDQTGGYTRRQDSPMERLSLIKDLETPPRVKFTDLEKLAGADSGVLFDKDPLKLDLRIDYFRQSEDKVITAISVQTYNKDIKFSDTGEPRTATLNVFGRITAVSGKRSGIFEDSVVAYTSGQDLIDLRDQKSIYQKAIALTPGTYKVDVVVRDVGTGKAGTVKMGFVVPRYDEKRLSSSTLVLTSKLRPSSDSEIGQLFVIGKTKVVPNLGSIYKQGQDVGIFMQIYNAEIDQTTLRPAVDVDYIITKDQKEVIDQREDWSGSSDSGRRLTLAHIFSTKDLAAGDYVIKVVVKDRVTGQVIENKEKFTIVR